MLEKINSEFERCPSCGAYRGQYHRPECPYSEETEPDPEQDDRELYRIAFDQD